METYRIYTDGAASNNGKPNAIGGWAYVILNGNDDIIHYDTGAEHGATNNQMEMTAVIEGCNYAFSNLIDEKSIMDSVSFHVYSDSGYVMECKNKQWYYAWKQNGWKTSNGKDVKNQEYWKLLFPYFDNEDFTFHQVKGHSTDPWNNYVDELAVSARLKLKDG